MSSGRLLLNTVSSGNDPFCNRSLTVKGGIRANEGSGRQEGMRLGYVPTHALPLSVAKADADKVVPSIWAEPATYKDAKQEKQNDRRC